MIRKEIKPELINTYHTIEMLRADYELEMFKFTDDRLNKFKDYYYSMNEFERDIMILYAEYDSYRKVADETYCSHQTVKLILSIIRQEINKLND